MNYGALSSPALKERRRRRKREWGSWFQLCSKNPFIKIPRGKSAHYGNNRSADAKRLCNLTVDIFQPFPPDKLLDCSIRPDPNVRIDFGYYQVILATVQGKKKHFRLNPL